MSMQTVTDLAAISTSGTATIDLENKPIALITIEATGTLEITATNIEECFLLVVSTTQDGTGGHAITFDGDVFETNSPSLTTGANKVDTWIFTRVGSKLRQVSFEADVS